jgi:hypothetical protein
MSLFIVILSMWCRYSVIIKIFEYFGITDAGLSSVTVLAVENTGYDVRK